MNINNLFRDGRHYDALNNFSYDINFYQEECLKVKGSILELGCGTGRILSKLRLNKSQKIYGLDNSSSMLNVLREKTYSSNIFVVRQDMRYFRISDDFDLIYIPFDSFCHLLNDSDIKNCIDKIKLHLNINGKLIIDVSNPDIGFISSKKTETIRARYNDPYNNDKITIFQSSTYNSSSRIHFIRWKYKYENKVVYHDFKKRIFVENDLKNMLIKNNFKIIEHFGWYDRSIYSNKSKRNIIISTKID